MVKFGGYDKFGMSDPNQLMVFKTTDPQNWQLLMTDLRLNGHTLIPQG